MAPENIRPANQDAPTSGDLFATVLVVAQNEHGFPEFQYENIASDPEDRVTETALQQSRITASVQFFRTGALDAAKKFKRRVFMSDTNELTTSYGLGFVSCSDVRNLTALVNEVSEERAQLDVVFYCINQEVINVNTYGVFPINVKMRAA